MAMTWAMFYHGVNEQLDRDPSQDDDTIMRAVASASERKRLSLRKEDLLRAVAKLRRQREQ